LTDLDKLVCDDTCLPVFPINNSNDGSSDDHRDAQYSCGYPCSECCTVDGRWCCVWADSTGWRLCKRQTEQKRSSSEFLFIVRLEV